MVQQSVMFSSFSDELEKIAKVKGPLSGRVLQYLKKGRKKGFIFDKPFIKKVRKEQGGSVVPYLMGASSKL